MDCAIKSTLVTFFRTALTQTQHICQICALWKFLSGFSIVSNYVQSDAIKSHSFHISHSISTQKCQISFQFSRPIFWQFLATKKLNEGAICAGLGSLGCISNNDVQFLFRSRHRHRIFSTRTWHKSKNVEK